MEKRNLQFRIDPADLARIDEHAARLAAPSGIAVSRGAAARALLLSALTAAESDLYAVPVPRRRAAVSR